MNLALAISVINAECAEYTTVVYKKIITAFLLYKYTVLSVYIWLFDNDYLRVHFLGIVLPYTGIFLAKGNYYRVVPEDVGVVPITVTSTASVEQDAFIHFFYSNNKFYLECVHI